MSRSSPSDGSRGSPGAEAASSGHGFGLSWQKRRKSLPARLQDREIALHVAGREARGRTGVLVAADQQPGLVAGLRKGAGRTFERRERHGDFPVSVGEIGLCGAHLITGARHENQLNMGAGSRWITPIQTRSPIKDPRGTQRDRP